MKSGGFHTDFMKSGGFHTDFTCEIQRISWNPWNPVDFTQISPVKSTQNYKSKCFSKNSSVWWMQGGGYDQGFHPWNLADFTQISPVKSTQIIKASVSAKTLQFDECRVGDFTLEIQWISPWNLVDFTHEIWQISPRFDLWNPPKIIKASVLAKTLQFDKCRVGDFTLEIQWISPVKSGGFDLCNLVDFTQIWPVKSTLNYKSKCFNKNSSVWWMQGGAMTKDFMKSTRFHPEIWWIWPVKSTQNYKSKCFSKNSSVWWMQGGGYDQGFHPWNLADFTQISPVKSTQIIKASVSAKTLQFDECRVGAMTKDFMKSTRFHPEIWWIWPVKSGGFNPDLTCEIHPKL